MSIARFERISAVQWEKDSAAYPTRLPLAEIPLPSRATVGSAGYDIACPVEITLQPGEKATVPTGIRVWMEPGWVLMDCPRSSMGRKHDLRLANTIGIIDSDYYYAENEGHLLVMLVNGGDHTVTIRAGERFVQGIFLPYGYAEEEPVTAQRTGGYGSTGK